MNVSFLESLWVLSPLRSRMQRADLRALRSLRRMPEGALVLEVGCGNGAGLEHIRNLFAPARMMAVDLDPAMIRRARRRHRSRLHTVCLGVADAEHLPIMSRSVDAVFELGVMHHLPDWRAGLSEIARVLRHGATFYFEEIYPALYANTVTRALLKHPRRDRFDGPAFRAALEQRGLRLVPGYQESRWRILGAAIRAQA